MLVELLESIPGCVCASDNGDGTYRVDFVESSRLATQAEITAALAAAARAAVLPVSRKQMLIALHRAGLLDSIKAYVAGSGDPELDIAWNEALTFERSDPFLNSAAALMGKTDAEVDQIFALAGSIR